MASQPGFFDLDERYSALSKANDPLERVSGVVDFEVFRSSLMRALRRSDRSKGGRPPFEPFYKDVIHLSAPAIHTDLDLGVQKDAGEPGAGKLTML